VYQIYSAISNLGHEPGMIFCQLLEFLFTFPVAQQKLGEFSSNKLYRQLCIHYEHSSRSIRGCRYGEEGLYFKFSKTGGLSKTGDTIVGAW
jgi:hypothetical protein